MYLVSCAEPDISLCNSMAREVVSLPLPCHPSVSKKASLGLKLELSRAGIVVTYAK